MTLGAIAGYDEKDPYTWNVPVPDFMGALDGDIKGLRIGVIAEQINSEVVEPEVREAVVNATTVLTELGASVEEVSLPLTEDAGIITWVYLRVEPALNHRNWIRERFQDYAYGNRIGLLTGSILPAQIYYKAQKLRGLVRRQIHQALETYDALVLPTLGVPAQKVGGGKTR